MGASHDRIRAVLLDAGNTLVCLDYDELARVLGDLGFAFTPDRLRQAEYAGRRAVNDEVASGGTSVDLSRMRTYFGAILESLGLAPAQIEPVFESLKSADRQLDRGLWRVVPPGTHRALETLKARGLIVGVVSNSDGRLASLLERSGLTPCLEFAIDSFCVGAEKPDPRIFRMGIAKAGVDPAEAVYVGDLWEIDIVGARRVGMGGILVDPLMNEPRSGSRIRTVAELPALLTGS